MKCIKNQSTGEIRRVKDDLAWKMKSMGWGYIPKSEWKMTTKSVDVKEKEPKVLNGDGKPRRNREKKTRR